MFQKCIFQVFSRQSHVFFLTNQNVFLKGKFSPDKAVYFSDKAASSRACTSPIAADGCYPLKIPSISWFSLIVSSLLPFVTLWKSPCLHFLVFHHSESFVRALVTSSSSRGRCSSRQHSDYLLTRKSWWKWRGNINTWFQKGAFWELWNV